MYPLVPWNRERIINSGHFIWLHGRIIEAGDIGAIPVSILTQILQMPTLCDGYQLSTQVYIMRKGDKGLNYYSNSTIITRSTKALR